MKKMIISVLMLFFISVPTFAQQKSSVADQIRKELNTTDLKTRIVKIKIKEAKKNKVDITFTWHPISMEKIPHDMMMIVQSIGKAVPNYNNIRIRAIHPDYMRWSKYIIWDALVTKKSFFVIQDQNRKQPKDEQLPLYVY